MAEAMKENTQPNIQAFYEKISTYLESHQKIVGEFRKSLENAQNFLELAKLSSEQEPENTIEMLEQIKEIDLLGHLGRQFEAFQEVGATIPANSLDPAVQLQTEKFDDLEKQYEDLLEQAEDQLGLLDDLLAQLVGNA